MTVTSIQVLTPAEELSLAGQQLHTRVSHLVEAIGDNYQLFTVPGILLRLSSLCSEYQAIYNAQELHSKGRK